MKLVFISDLHLAPETKEHNQIFFELLEQWQGKIDSLYILGDFFDYWIGDDDDNQFIRDIKSQLRKFSIKTPIYFKGGNHDFAIGRRFAGETGIKLIPDMHTIKNGTDTILLSHGDTFCTLDVGYQKMKRILQNPITIFVCKLFPLSIRYKIKEKLENKSKQQTNTKPEAVYHVVEDSIIEYAAKAKANIVIHGHTHKPGSYSINTSNGTIIRRYEIPDWQDHLPGGYIILSGNDILINQPH